jgi:phosphopantothenoylcysteine decarboxylase/phosphopantothenate--cysteine ligase
VKKQDGEMVIELERTQDILAWLGQHKGAHQILCGFAMETQQMVEHAREKLVKKNLDLIAANNVKVSGAGFGTDTNVVTLITEQETRELELMSKEEVAVQITDELLRLRSLKCETESEQ